MHRLTAPALALALVLGVPAVALADEPAPEPAPMPTTTAVTASRPDRDSNTVTLTVTVGAEDSVPEGDVELTDGGTPLATVPLEGGAASWTGSLATGWHSVVAIYHPVDERWESSASAPAQVFAGNHCAAFVDTCLPNRLSITMPRTVRAGKRFKLAIRVSSIGAIKVYGRATITIVGPRHFSWSRKVRVVRRPTMVRSPRLHRPGAYKTTVLFEPDDGGPAHKGSGTVRVKSPERV